jgi:thienamycin biosynthesis protein ThnO
MPVSAERIRTAPPLLPGRRGAVVPLLVGAQRHRRDSAMPLRGGNGDVIAHVTSAPRLVQSRMVALAEAAGPELAGLGDAEWWALYARAARRLEDHVTGPPDSAGSDCVSLTSRATGLPEERVRHALVALAADCARMREILAAQAPARVGWTNGRRWAWAPAGRHVAVRVPDNFPTINIQWLQALATRRPVLLSTSPRDPFTALVLAGLFYEAGLPDGAVSVCHGDAPAFWHLADQILWPGDAPAWAAPADRHVKTYHHGRSKAILLDDSAPADVWSRLASLAMQGAGRLCTNVSALLASGGAERAGVTLAEALAEYPVLPLDHPRAMIPAAPDTATASGLAATVRAALDRGAIDLSARLTGMPLQIQLDDRVFLRPTVLKVAADDPIFGAELPFPFVTVADVARSKFVRAACGSLVVSVVGDDPALVAALVAEPSIDKVFHGEQFDRGFDPLDPHEGYLVDFLFQKKAVQPPLDHSAEEAPR